MDMLGLKANCDKECNQSWTECYTNCINTLAPHFSDFFIGAQVLSNLPWTLSATPLSNYGVLIEEVPSGLFYLSRSAWTRFAAISRIIRPIQNVVFSYVAGASYGCMISCGLNKCNY